MEIIRRNFATSGPEIRQAKDGKRVYRFTASDETYDRYETIIKVDGWKIDAYQKNGTILWAHDPHLLPVGKGAAFVEDGKRSGSKRRLAVDVTFADHPFAREVEKLYADGALNTVSVGFRPISKGDATEDERAAFGIPEDKACTVYREHELYEISCVPVPGNPNALLDRLAETAGDEVRDIPEAAVTEEFAAEQLGLVYRGLNPVEIVPVEDGETVTERLDRFEARIVEAIEKKFQEFYAKFNVRPSRTKETYIESVLSGPERKKLEEGAERLLKLFDSKGE